MCSRTIALFPAYDAVLFFRRDARPLSRNVQALQRLEGRITTRDMIAMNAAAELSAVPFQRVAADFLTGKPAAVPPAAGNRRNGPSWECSSVLTRRG